MVRDAWYRNKTWSADAAAEFNARLQRTRDPGSYLRLQAGMLSKSAPAAALELLERFFALGDHPDGAQAQVDKARAHAALNQWDLAVDAYRAALAREDERPKWKTQAYVEFPFAVAERGARVLYEECLRILEKNVHRPMFPVDHFLWSGCRAVFLEALGRRADARAMAAEALKCARQNRSGVPRRPSLGLVGEEHAQLKNRLCEIAREAP